MLTRGTFPRHTVEVFQSPSGDSFMLTYSHLKEWLRDKSFNPLAGILLC